MTANHPYQDNRKPSLCFAHAIVLTIYALCVAFLFFTPTTYKDYNLRLTYGENIANPPQLYYDTGEGFQEALSIFATCTDKTADFILDDNIRDNSISLRIDPVSGTILDLRLHSLSVVLKGEEIQSFSGKALQELFSAANHIDGIEVQDSDIILAVTGEDPQLIINESLMNGIPDYIQRYNASISRLYILYASILTLLLCILIFFRKWPVYFGKKLYLAIRNQLGEERLSKCNEYWCSCAAKLPLCRKIAYAASAIIFTTTALLYSIGRFLTHYFSGLTMQEIVFHLKVPMAGTGADMLTQYFASAKILLIASGIILAVAILLLTAVKKIRNCRLAMTISLMLSLALCILACADFSARVSLPEYIAKQIQRSSFIENNYVMPEKASITFPETKRNLIYIYLESMESTFISKEEGGCMKEDLIPELTKLAKENINFSDCAQVGGGTSSAGSNWTVAAMTTMSCGLPLLIPIDGNSYGEYTTFLPGAVSLGDILKDNGYVQEIMVGSDLSFGGRRNFFTQHGDYIVYDLYTARKRKDLPDDYYNNWWGFEDAKLFSYAKEERGIWHDGGYYASPLY